MSLPTLEPGLRDAYLDRLGVPAPSRNLAGLTSLQQAHLRRIPFHNLALVANAGRSYRVPQLQEIAAANARGVGGTCHLTTPAFAALVHTLGFEVDLIAGSVNHPGDHLLALVRCPEGAYVVDVGNGHPYLRPFPLARELRWQAYGWQFCWSGHTLTRRLDDGRERRVYTVDTAPRTWASFAEAIRAHHECPDFGPFFASLRAVRVEPEVMLVVRDATFTRYGALGPSSRPLTSLAAARRVLSECIGLSTPLVDTALERLAIRRPELFGPGSSSSSPRVLIAVPTIGRSAQLEALLGSLEGDRVASGLEPDELEVLILDNRAAASERANLAGAPWSFAVHCREVDEPALELERRLGLIPAEAAPLCIGGARHALVHAIAEHLTTREGEWIVWMLDDDLRLAQLVRDVEGLHERRELPLLAELRRLWAERPELSIGLGCFCGDPPIPGFATWLGQLRDLEATLEIMARRAPDQPWPRPAQLPDQPDDYYDHAGDTLDPEACFVFEDRAGASVAETFSALARAWPRVLRGAQVTRPLVWSPAGSQATLARGGNVVCFDLDALLAAPFPALRCEDGVVTRRADSLAALLARGGPWRTEAIDLPLLHGRRAGDGSSPIAATRRGADELARFAESQARGIAMVRALQSGEPGAVSAQLERRRQLHRDGFAATREVLASARARLVVPTAWWWSAPFEADAHVLLASLDELAAVIPSDATLERVAADVGAELEAFVTELETRAESWRRAWP
jgi:arylamine N-acetyltransferase